MPDAPATLPFAFEVLYERLRQEGFRVGVDHQMRLQQLLNTPAVYSGEIQPVELETLLCPLFATKRAQQEAFYRIFKGVYGDASAAATEKGKVKPAGKAKPSLTTWELLSRGWIFKLLLVVVALLIYGG